jgi:4-hydroxy-2-oxoglutarate aldolase
VSGIPNFAPAASARLWALLNQSEVSADEKREAERIQTVLSKADVAAVPAGVRGMSKSGSQIYRNPANGVLKNMY